MLCRCNENTSYNSKTLEFITRAYINIIGVIINCTFISGVNRDGLGWGSIETLLSFDRSHK